MGCVHSTFHHSFADIDTAKNIRLLLVIANLGQFKKVVIPGMITQLESAFGASMAEDQAVSLFFDIWLQY